ncbi:MAG: TetR/AcrR family transcriptional regulator [Lachnospiraceae bacterium]|nr:TetR/AcrR family transcriptional regulator [Lachnospiraceae bacterium]
MAIARTPEEEQVVRDNLIATCAKVFLRDGYSKVTMKSLADEAGCTTGKFYSNFAGKPEILRVLMEKLTRTTYNETMKLLAEEGDTPMEKLMLFFVTQYEICHVNEKIRELFHFAYEDSEALSAVADFFKEDLRTALEQTYGKKMDEQTLVTITTMGFCAMRGIIMSEYKGYAYEENQQIAYMMDLILYIYGIQGKDAEALYARIEKAKPQLREATYNLIIYILQTKLL